MKLMVLVLKSLWSLVALAGAVLVGTAVVHTLHSKNYTSVASVIAIYALLGVVLLCSVSLAWDSLKRLARIIRQPGRQPASVLYEAERWGITGWILGSVLAGGVLAFGIFVVPERPVITQAYGCSAPSPVSEHSRAILNFNKLKGVWRSEGKSVQLEVRTGEQVTVTLNDCLSFRGFFYAGENEPRRRYLKRAMDGNICSWTNRLQIHGARVLCFDVTSSGDPIGVHLVHLGIGPFYYRLTRVDEPE